VASTEEKRNACAVFGGKNLEGKLTMKDLNYLREYYESGPYINKKGKAWIR
jgi:hypothetical protein